MTAPMNLPKLAIIFVPGIRPKPAATEHSAQLKRCITAGVLKAGGSQDEARDIAHDFALVGWSADFYGEHGDISIDMPGIERLLAGKDSAKADLHEAGSFKRRFLSWMYFIANRFPMLSSHFSTRRMQSRVVEMTRYFSNESGKAAAARQLVKNAVMNAWSEGSHVVLIGHSFGSVIAYDAMWELSRGSADKQIDVFLTMGSPLTMTYIRERLLGADLPVTERYPQGIRRWLNLTAVGEVTSQNRKLEDCFAEMKLQGLVEAIDDDLGLINQFHGPDGLNVHKCYGYFASKTVGSTLLDEYRLVAGLGN
jgi:hypothetical protein